MNSGTRATSLLTALPRLLAAGVMIFTSVALAEATTKFAPVRAQAVNPVCINANLGDDSAIAINVPGFWYYQSSSPNPAYATRAASGSCNNYWRVGIANAQNRRVQILADWADTPIPDPASCATSGVNYYVWGWRNGNYTPLGGGSLGGKWTAQGKCIYTPGKFTGSGAAYILSSEYSYYRVSAEAYKTGGCMSGKCPQNVKVEVYTDPPMSN